MTEKVREKLLGKTPAAIREITSGLGLPAYVGSQLSGWLYKSGVTSFEEMTNISLKNREILKEHFSTGITAPLQVQVSADGTRKYLYPALSDKFIETALMPEKTRSTLCVSTQVGCRMGCAFCHTGKQGFQGNLTAGEIVNQLRSLPEREQVTNIVFMGMGEPFDNLSEVMASLEVLTADWGFGFSPRKITVSTIGIIPGMRTFLENSECNLAISLHSPFDEERRQLMPIEKAYPVKEVIEVLVSSGISRYRRVSFEYILFRGINDSGRHVKELARLLNKVKCRINLMRFHPFPGAGLEGSDEETVQAFQKGLNEKGIIATVRQSRGLDIAAACGLLSTKMMMNL